MIAAVLSIGILALVTALSTLATVLLARFYLGRFNSDIRIVVAGLGGPGWILTPFFIYMAISQGLGDVVTLLTLLAMAIGFIIVGWPISYLATRKLDRLTQPDTTIFE